MSNVMSKFGDFYRNHKGKIIIAAGVIGAVVVSGLLSRNDDSEEQEIVVEPTRVKQDYELVWIQSNDVNKSYTIDLPVSNDSTVESDMNGILEDLNTGNWHKADL